MLQQGVFKGFSFFLAFGSIFLLLDGFLLVLGILGLSAPKRLEGSRFAVWQLHRLATGGSRE